MQTAETLKEKARALEHSGQDQAALDLYVQMSEEGTQPDPAVLVRMGNLQRRLGRPEQAISSFMRSADLLEEAGFPNSALALCHRVLHIQPDFAPALRKVAELSGREGYARNARESVLRFADRAEQAGDPEEGVDALRGYLRTFPQDAATRSVLVDRLEALGRSEEAEEARSAGEALPARPEPPAADEEALAELGGPDAGAADAEPGLEVMGSGWEGAELPDAAAEPEPDLGLLPTRMDEAEETEAAEGAVAPLAGLEPTLVEGMEPTGLDDGWPEEASPQAEEEPLPLMGADIDSGWEASPPEPGPAVEEEEGEDDGAGLPLLGTEAFAEPEGDLPGGEEPAVDDPAVRLRARIVEDPADLDARHELIALLQERGEAEALVAALEEAHPAFAAAGRVAEATDLASELIELRPDDEGLLRRRVEYAEGSGEPSRVVAALLALGRRVSAREGDERAEEIFRRVLELDPENESARAALDSLAPSAPEVPATDEAAEEDATPEAPEESEEEEYLDFGAMLLADEPEATTRAQVAVQHPTGDEQRDFDEILSLFRQQVSERIDPGDAASHYDLGLAFKEMGLLDDAIQQLQVALRGGANPVATLEVLGECFLEKGDPSLAVRVFRRATEIPSVDEGALVGIRYWLGRCEEALGNPDAARGEYERVVAVDLGFRDAAARLEALRS